MNELQLIAEHDWLPFTAHKLTNTRIVWAEHRLAKSDVCKETIKEIDKLFLQNNAYAIQSTECFESVEFDNQDSKTLVAERYGGPGVGSNGGGARCGNWGDVQLKGIGANYMAGDHGDYVHKYGGLDAPLAIVETIYTYTLNKVLPLGAVKIHGLIFVGENTGYNIEKDEPCWGLIMVRDKCIRPAHFMRAPLFKPHSKHKQILVGDVGRMRILNKRIANALENHNEFIALLGKYLQNCANQFDFARAARIMHGSVTASNISVDGRWLDVPLSSFVDGGINYKMASIFYDEHIEPLSWAIELLHSYGKYNNIVLNPKPLTDYYNEQFYAHFRYYMGFVLGFSLEMSKEFNTVNWYFITDLFYKTIHSGKSISMYRATRNPKDPVHALIAALFLSTASPSAAKNDFKAAGIAEENSAKAVNYFSQIMTQAFNVQAAKLTKISSKSFRVSTALYALKRAYLSEVFFLPAIDIEVRTLISTKTPEDIAPLINSYRDLTDWIFEADTDTICLFKSPELQISYLKNTECYELSIAPSTSAHFNSFSSIFGAIQELDEEMIHINSFSFKTYFENLYRVIPLIETASLV
jgi:hypothetical protein